uniref:Chromodomain-helicase-DNA-binding protein n=2 Tax=Mucochytrium quahogii TaxID=96639 RepID=A0A7S2RL01_9STRA|mmetsp:Transcript_19048/g.31754  ORF Transcript_19048/g.31754 Transcript_19048/m.31754 type:complete len:2207 (+) Transcript_19048:281-6901(+)
MMDPDGEFFQRGPPPPKRDEDDEDGDGAPRRSRRKRNTAKYAAYFEEGSDDDLLDSEDERQRKNAENEEENEEDQGPKVERLLGMRLVGKGPLNEFLVKYKNQSYLHVVWMHENVLKSMDPRYGQMVQRFKSKQRNKVSNPDEDDDEYFDPRYTEVDRILADTTQVYDVGDVEIVAELRWFEYLGGLRTNRKKFDDNNQVDVTIDVSPEGAVKSKSKQVVRKLYLVKWCELSYKEATWEFQEDVGDDIKIAQYHRRNRPPTLRSNLKDQEDDMLWPALNKHRPANTGDKQSSNSTSSSDTKDVLDNIVKFDNSRLSTPFETIKGRKVRTPVTIHPVLAPYFLPGEIAQVMPFDEIVAVEGVSMQGLSLSVVSNHVRARVAEIRGLSRGYTITFRRFISRKDKPDAPIETLLFNVCFGAGSLGLLLKNLRDCSHLERIIPRPPNALTGVYVEAMLKPDYYTGNRATLHYTDLALRMGVLLYFQALLSRSPNDFTMETLASMAGVAPNVLVRWFQGWPVHDPYEDPGLGLLGSVEGSLWSMLVRNQIIHRISTYGFMNWSRLSEMITFDESKTKAYVRRVKLILGGLNVLKQNDVVAKNKKHTDMDEHGMRDNFRVHALVKVAPILDDLISKIEDKEAEKEKNSGDILSSLLPSPWMGKDFNTYRTNVEVYFDANAREPGNEDHVYISKQLNRALRSLAYTMWVKRETPADQVRATAKFHRQWHMYSESAKIAATQEYRLKQRQGAWERILSTFPFPEDDFVGEVDEYQQRDLQRQEQEFRQNLATSSTKFNDTNAIQGTMRGFRMQKQILLQMKRNGFVPYTARNQPRYKHGNMLRNYQLNGINWILSHWYDGVSCILADEMGLGKTVQVVATLEHLRTREGVRGPFLVVAPLSTIGHWHREVENWTDMNLCKYYDGGGAEARDVIRRYEWYFPGLDGRKDLLKFNVMVTTYETFMMDVDYLTDLPWVGVVVDEGHRLRSSKSKLLDMMNRIKGANRLLLTGTPLQNNISELWSLLNYCDPHFFYDHEVFLQKYGDMRSKEQLDQLQAEIAPYMLRRVKEDVEKSIPPKEETIIDIELTMIQKRYYRAIFDKNRQVLYKGCKSGNKPQLINVEMELRKCCNHPFLIAGVQDNEFSMLNKEIKKKMINAGNQRATPSPAADVGNASPAPVTSGEPPAGTGDKPQKELVRKKSDASSKSSGDEKDARSTPPAAGTEKPSGNDDDDDDDETKVLDALIKQGLEKNETRDEIFEEAALAKCIRSSGKLVLVDKLLPKLRREGHKVLIFSQMVKMLDMLQYYCKGRGYPVERLDGGVQGNVRQASIDRFSNPEGNSFIFLLSTRAGGVGINLTAADTVIIFDSDWNPQNDAQAQARVHRIGQKKAVKIFRLVTKNTYEETMLQRAALKLGLERAVLGSVHESSGKRNQDSQQGVGGKSLSPAELEKMLREGAYHHLQDDDGSAARTFVGADIDDLLKTNARTVVMDRKTEGEGGGALDKLKHNTVNKSSFKAEREDGVDVNDPDFWAKVLPDMATPDTILGKLNDSTESSVLKSNAEKRRSFMEDVRGLVRDIVTQRTSGELVNEHDMETTVSILVQISNMGTTFGNDSFQPENNFKKPYTSLALKWLERLEGLRQRRARREKKGSKKKKGKHVESDDELFSAADSDEEMPQVEEGDDDDENNSNSKYAEDSDVGVEEEDTSAEPILQKDHTTEVCTLCADGGALIICEGPCKHAFHLNCLSADARKHVEEVEEWFCPDCENGMHTCVLCGENGYAEVLPDGVFNCQEDNCGRFHHIECIRKSKHGIVLDEKSGKIVCPLHVCDKCDQGEPVPTVQCIRCSKAFHATGDCLDLKKTLRLHRNLIICNDHLQGKRLNERKLLQTHKTFDPRLGDGAKHVRPSRRPRRSAAKPKSKGTPAKKPPPAKQRSRPKRSPDEPDLIDEKWRETEGVGADEVVIRTCALCTRDGKVLPPSEDSMDDQNGEAMLPYPFLQTRGKDKHVPIWLHMKCAAFTPEVFTDEEQRFYSVLKAVRRGRFITCNDCGQRGATVGCYNKQCNRSFHVPCTVSSGWDITADPEFLCPAHRKKGRNRGRNGTNDDDGDHATDDGEEEEEEEEDSMEDVPSKRSRRARGAKNKPPKRGSTRRQKRASSPAYISEDEDQDGSEAEVYSVSKRRRRAPSPPQEAFTVEAETSQGKVKVTVKTSAIDSADFPKK